MKDKKQAMTVGLLEEILDKRLVNFGMLVSDAILQGVQRMFDEQNRQNDLKFATKFELKEVKNKVDKNYEMVVEMIGEVKAMREEHTVSGYRQIKHTDQFG